MWATVRYFTRALVELAHEMIDKGMNIATYGYGETRSICLPREGHGDDLPEGVVAFFNVLLAARPPIRHHGR